MILLRNSDGNGKVFIYSTGGSAANDSYEGKLFVVKA